MADLLTSLPGDIPGLLRRGSPVVFDDRSRGLVERNADGGAVPVLRGPLATLERPADVALDLTDPTGRVHAAWWADEQAPGTSAHEHRGVSPFMSIPERTAVARAQQCHAMTPAQIDTLARLVLRLAGR